MSTDLTWHIIIIFCFIQIVVAIPSRRDIAAPIVGCTDFVAEGNTKSIRLVCTDEGDINPTISVIANTGSIQVNNRINNNIYFTWSAIDNCPLNTMDKLFVVCIDAFGNTDTCTINAMFVCQKSIQPNTKPIHPTMDPTYEPTIEPTIVPTKHHTIEPTNEPTIDPTIHPTIHPTNDPTIEPTYEPTIEPTNEPTIDPTIAPTIDPTINPTTDPTIYPTIAPTIEPTNEPTIEPTIAPTIDPTIAPTQQPSTHAHEPTNHPTIDPTSQPTAVDPTRNPTIHPFIVNPPLNKKKKTIELMITVDHTIDTIQPTSETTIDMENDNELFHNDYMDNNIMLNLDHRTMIHLFAVFSVFVILILVSCLFVCEYCMVCPCDKTTHLTPLPGHDEMFEIFSV